METEKPNYYAILTADIRYDKKLNPFDKLLYAEITALTGKEGICWASNRYFADLYGVTTVYISQEINKLKKLGYIKIDYEYKKNTREISKRNIYLLNNNLRGIKQKFNGGIKQKFKDNNIKNNNINIINLTTYSEEDLDNLYDN